MSDPVKQLIGVVIKADGTVPFDDDVHPDHRAHILGWLADQGHTVVPVPGIKHVKIAVWPKA